MANPLHTLSPALRHWLRLNFSDNIGKARKNGHEREYIATYKLARRHGRSIYESILIAAAEQHILYGAAGETIDGKGLAHGGK